MRKLWTIPLCLLCACFATSCQDDDGNDIPSLITDLVEVHTDADGMGKLVKMDDGKTYSIHQKLELSQPDSLFRCMASYTQAGDQVTFYDIVRVYSDAPHPVDDYYMVVNGVAYHDASMLPRDPVKVVSMWKSGGYINMHLGVKTTDMATHQYGFCEDSLHHYSLLHRRPSHDQESYTDQVYLSMPIPEGEDELTFTINTYDGLYSQTF